MGNVQLYITLHNIVSDPDIQCVWNSSETQFGRLSFLHPCSMFSLAWAAASWPVPLCVAATTEPIQLLRSPRESSIARVFRPNIWMNWFVSIANKCPDWLCFGCATLRWETVAVVCVLQAASSGAVHNVGEYRCTHNWWQQCLLASRRSRSEDHLPQSEFANTVRRFCSSTSHSCDFNWWSFWLQLEPLEGAPHLHREAKNAAWSLTPTKQVSSIFQV